MEFHRIPTRGRGKALILAGTALIVAGCATVKQDQFEAEMAQVRSEIRDGDQAVESRLGQRIDQTEARLEARIGAVERALTELRSEFEVTVERLETAIRFNAPVHFAFDDDQVRASDRPVLDRFAQVVSEYYPQATITVEGFTDPAGSAEYNRRLGMRRAESVMNYLATQGLGSAQMRAVSYGQDQARLVVPGASGPGEEGWQNRRVAMVIDFSPSAQAQPRVASTGGEGGDEAIPGGDGR
jgi:peptidoglycan-associated lipoprotein